VVFQSNQTKFTTNDYNKVGGAVYAHSSNPYFRNVEFKYNTASHQGGAIYVHQADTNKTITFERTTFTSNSVTPGTGYGTDLRGGAVYLRYSGKVVFENCVFDSNSIKINSANSNRGGAIFSHQNYDSLVVRNTKFRYNKVYKPDGNNGGSTHGGAIYVEDGRDHFFVTNSVFIGNESLASYYSYDEGGGYDNNGHGGAIYLNIQSHWNGSAYTYPHKSIFINNTFVDNKAESSGNNSHGYGGAFYYSGQQSTVLINNNFWGNTEGSDTVLCCPL
jgi:predicted outer membrane repeat protein